MPKDSPLRELDRWAGEAWGDAYTHGLAANEPAVRAAAARLAAQMARHRRLQRGRYRVQRVLAPLLERLYWLVGR